MALPPGSELPVNPNVEKFGVGLSWDKGGAAVDVDLQAVIVDSKGTIIDAAYYNNLKAVRAVTHSGDETTGAKAGLDEIVWVKVKALPAEVQIIIFVVAAFNRGHLKDVQNGRLSLLEDSKDNAVGQIALEKSEEEVDAVAMMVKDAQGCWNLRIINEPAQDGRHFIDILEPTLGNLIRGVIPSAPKRQKVAFAMEKGAVVDLPDSSSMRRISAGLGWDVAKNLGKDVDLDVSVVFFSQDGGHVGAVFFGNTEEFGVKHSGDNLTGAGSGDDETIQVDLQAIPESVAQAFFCVNIYTKGVTFDRVSNAYCRVSDEMGNEIARYILREAGGQSGLIIARLMREPGGRWGFQALGQLCRGQTWKDSLMDIQPLVQKAARELQMRGSTVSLGGAPSGAAGSGAQPPAAPAPVAQAPQARHSTKASSKPCALM